VGWWWFLDFTFRVVVVVESFEGEFEGDALDATRCR
jgi:hypothetical protein